MITDKVGIGSLFGSESMESGYGREGLASRSYPNGDLPGRGNFNPLIALMNANFLT
jgi:hypothetical protein